MKTTIKEKFKEVKPEKGFMLYNGDEVSDGLIAPVNADLSAWREITIEDAERLQMKLQAEMENKPE